MIGKIRLILILLSFILSARLLAGSPSISYNFSLTTPVITFTIPANTHADANGNITPNGTSTSSESPIYYTSSDPTKATITPDGLIHLVGAGPVTITAHQDASTNYNAAVPVDALVSIILSQRLTFPPISNKTICDLDFLTSVTTSSVSGNPISYTSSDNTVAKVSTIGMVSIVGPGTVTITAVQAGSTYYTEGTSSQTFIVSPPENPTISINAGTYIPCYGANVTFTATVTHAGSSPIYEWQINNNPVLNNNTNTLNRNTFHNNDIISCTVTNTTDCSTAPNATAIDTLILNTNLPTTVSIASSASGPVCSGSSITFTATSNISPANASYKWLVNGSLSGTNSPTFTTTTLNDSDEVTCLLTARANACVPASTATSNIITASINTNEIPLITIEASANNINAGTPVTFTATVSNITATPFYQWQVNGIAAGTNNPAFTTDGLKNNDVVTCTVTSVTGCVAPTTSLPVTMVVLPPPTVSINNMFTPNGDGINDTWTIPDLGPYPNCQVSIFDRSGAVVYQSTGYSKPWDGTRNGHSLPAGTYYYLVKLPSKGSSLSGSITIIR